jgi:hypothetical protein
MMDSPNSQIAAASLSDLACGSRFEIGKRIKALVQSTSHFLWVTFQHPVMPGVLMLEASKQPPYSLSRLGCDAR